MSVLLGLTRFYLPSLVKTHELRRLLDLTATALARDPPSFAGRPYADCLSAYAQFTATGVEAAIADGEDLGRLGERLFSGGRRLGARYRRLFGVTTNAQAMEAARLLYRVLGIDLTASGDGNVIVTRCSFSSVYSPRVCRVIGSLDAGFMDGLSGGGRLTFTKRLTEGHDRCEACFVAAEAAG